MTNCADLHLQRDILPLFDFTHNAFSHEALVSLLVQPLASRESILLRQQILKGFIANHVVFETYSYATTDMHEVYTFLINYSDSEVSKRGLKRRLFFSERERHQVRSKYIQVILLLHRLHTYFIKTVNTTFFPESYKTELLALNHFLEGFNLSYFGEVIREQRFKIKHIVYLNEYISKSAASGELNTFWKRYFLFEAYLALSKGIMKHRFTFPTFSHTVFSLKEVYHPLLKQPVKNSFTSRSNVVLLTGPNMSGKSTFLKAIGICVYLGHIGVGVPASEASLPFFETISISINLNDDIRSGYSHFMSEVINLKKVVVEAVNNKKCFAVFDELFRGTNIEDAIDISSSTIRGLTRFEGSFFFISTHLHQLKEMEEIQKGQVDTYYIDCNVTNEKPHFTYILKQGWSDLRVGRILFEKEGLDKLLSSPKPIGTHNTSVQV